MEGIIKIHLKLQEELQRQDLLLKILLKGHNSGKNQLGITSIKYDHFQVMGTITKKFHPNPLKTVGGVVETRTSSD